MKKIILPFKTFFNFSNEKAIAIELKKEYVRNDKFNEMINQNDHEFVLNLQTKTKRPTKEVIFNLCCLSAFDFGQNCIFDINCPKNAQLSKIGEWRYWDEFGESNWALIKCKTLNINAFNDVRFFVANNDRESKMENLNIIANFYDISLDRINFKNIKLSKPKEDKITFEDINEAENIVKQKEVKYSKVHIFFDPLLESLDLSEYDDYIELPRLRHIPEKCKIKINKNSYIKFNIETVFTDDGWIDEKILEIITKKSKDKMVFIYGTLNGEYVDHLFVKADMIFDEKYLCGDYYELSAKQMMIEYIKTQKMINGLYFDEKTKRLDYCFDTSEPEMADEDELEEEEE